MIFVCLGTQIFQFDRLLIELDRLINDGVIKGEVFAQAGSINYVPRFFSYKKFLSHDDFERISSNADLIISHGGTGALIGALKKGKNVIAVPRLAKFGEHVDDHQLQIVELLEKQGFIRAVYDISLLGDTIKEAIEKPISKPYQKESNVLQIIKEFIDNN